MCAQTPLLKVIPFSEVKLSEQNQNIISTYTKLLSTKSAKLVQFNFSDKLLFIKKFEFSLPNEEKRIFNVERDTLYYNSGYDYFFGGNLMKDGFKEGTMYIKRIEDSFGGYFQYLDGYQYIIPLHDQLGLLVEYSSEKESWNCQDDSKSNQTTVEESTHNLEAAKKKCDYADYCNGFIDILCWVTPDAQKIVNGNTTKSGLQTSYSANKIFTSSMEYQTNQIFKNSLVGNKKVRLRMMLSDSIVLNPQDSTYELTRADVISKDNTNINKFYKADLICLLSEQGFSGGLAGIAPGFFSDYKIFAVKMSNFLTPYVFAHELGHKLDGRHEDDKKNDGENPCSHAYVITKKDPNKNDPDYYKTVVAKATYGRSIPYFSNPNTSYMGYVTSSGKECNAAVINNNFCIAKDYQPDSGFSAFITQNQTPCELQMTIDPVIGSVGKAPFAYGWEWSLNYNLQNSVFISNKRELKLIKPLSCQFYYVRGTITSSDGYTTFVDRKINPGWCPSCNNSSNTSKSYFNIFPNPTSTIINVEMNVNQDSKTDIKILDLNGRLVRIQNVDTYIGNNKIEVNIDSLQSGMYFIQIQNECDAYFEKFNIQH